MTTHTNSSSPASAAILAAAQQAYRSGTHPIPTASVLTAAERLLAALWATASELGVLPEDFVTLWGELAPVVYAGQIKAFERQQAGVDVDPLKLLTEVVRVAGEQLGEDLVVIEGPTASSEVRSYVVIGRLAATPAWGRDGNAPLMVRFDREDYAGGNRAPWEWSLVTDGPGPGGVATVQAPPPSIETAGEVARVVARVLSGELRAWA